MKIRSEPKFLNITDSSLLKCPKCDTILRHEITQDKYLKEECERCAYADRPFGYNSTYYRDTPCTCTYYEIDILIITCPLCIVPKCATCKEDILDVSNNYDRKCRFDEGKGIDCIQCENIKKKKEFDERWISMTIEEKLGLYGISKLRLLAKQKKLKRYSLLNKIELINTLTPITTIFDLPIR